MTVVLQFDFPLVRRLRAADRPSAFMVLLVLFTTVQMAVALTTVALPALAFACALFLAAACAAGFARRATARSIIALGGALAVVEIFDSIGAVVMAILMSVFAGTRLRGHSQNLGQLFLLLFLPVSTALLFAGLAHDLNFDSAALMSRMAVCVVHISPRIIFRDVRLMGLVNAAGLLVAGFPIWLSALRGIAPMTALIAGAVVFAMIVMALMGQEQDFASTAPAFAALSAAAFSEWPEGRKAAALFFAGVSAAFSWLYVMVFA